MNNDRGTSRLPAAAEPARHGELMPMATTAATRRPSRQERQFASLVVGAGLLTGLALTTLSPRHWSRLGALVFGGSAWLARSPLGPALLAALLARATGPGDPPPQG